MRAAAQRREALRVQKRILFMYTEKYQQATGMHSWRKLERAGLAFSCCQLVSGGSVSLVIDIVAIKTLPRALVSFSEREEFH